MWKATSYFSDFLQFYSITVTPAFYLDSDFPRDIMDILWSYHHAYWCIYDSSKAVYAVQTLPATYGHNSPYDWTVKKVLFSPPSHFPFLNPRTRRKKRHRSRTEAYPCQSAVWISSISWPNGWVGLDITPGLMSMWSCFLLIETIDPSCSILAVLSGLTRALDCGCSQPFMEMLDLWHGKHMLCKRSCHYRTELKTSRLVHSSCFG